MVAAVRPVRGRRDLGTFIDVPYRLHRNDPVWAPPLRSEVRALLDREKNPFFEHAEAEFFLAERDGQVVGRIGAIADRLHDETHGDGAAFFGFFECIDDEAVAAALFDAAAAWVRERGYRKLRGPASPSMNGECGLLVKGLDTPPTLMMPHNPAYYVRLVEGAGFDPVKDLLVYQVGNPTTYYPAPEKFERAAELVRKRTGATVRPLDIKRFREDVERVKVLYNAAWENNWGFVPMTDAEIDLMAKQFRPVVVPEMIPFVELEGRAIGFGLVMPDLNEVLRRNRRGWLVPGAARILWALKRRKLRRIRILALGVLPEYRNKGIDVLLYHWIWSRGEKYGYTWAEAGWVLADNPQMNKALERLTFDPYKTYRMYDRET